MSQQLHQQANALLYQALEQTPASRPAFLKQACGGSRALHELVNSMLSHIDQLDAFLEDRLAAPSAIDVPATVSLQPGVSIGAWRVLRALPRGALVERADGLRTRRAALTLVDAEALSLEELALFHRRRALLARLAHPNLAALIDSGTAPDGRPFVVMHHCDGVPLAEFCKATGLAPRERAALLLPVCHALHYAHQHLVLHRRLEPACVVVDRDGLVKLAEIGIAGLLDQPGDSGHFSTTADDVAALGRILAALVADRPEALRGDLGAIVARAAAAGANCYSSAADLAHDLQCFIERRPLLADQESVAARLGKGMRRHPIAGAAALLALAGIGATSALGTYRLATDSALHTRVLALAGVDTDPAARVRSAGARASARFVAGSVVSLADRRDQAEALYLRGRHGNLLEAIGAWHVLALAAEAKGMADIRTVALDRLARLRHTAGDFAGAQANAQELLSVLNKILVAVPEHPVWRARQAGALQVFGASAVDGGAQAAGVAALRQALAVREELAGEEAGVEAAQGIAAARVALAHGLIASADYASAETELKLAREVYAARSGDGDAQARVWEIDLARANGQYLRRHWKTAATTLHALSQSAGGAASELLQARVTLLQALIQPGGSAMQAYADARGALPLLLAATERDPDDALALADSALAWARVGEIGLRAGQKYSACGYLALAEERYELLAASKRLAAADHNVRSQLQRLRMRCA